MRLTFIGLTLSSSWGNGHATTYRGLLSALHQAGHELTFLEREQTWYAKNRDLHDPAYCDLRFYTDLASLREAGNAITGADAVIIGSYVQDGAAIARFVRGASDNPMLFYDIDTPVTMAAVDAGTCAYIDRDSITLYDAYLSFTGGPTLRRLEDEFGARSAHALYCCVDAKLHRPVITDQPYALGYLGTYSPDRQPALETLLIEPAGRRPDLRFIVAGPQYPDDIAWPANVERREHVAPRDHASFYAGCRFTLNVTRADMRAAGYSPSVRLFEAAAVGTPILSDVWPGIEDFFRPDREIILVDDAQHVLSALAMPATQRAGIAAAARENVLTQHTSMVRARELVEIIEGLFVPTRKARLLRA